MAWKNKWDKSALLALLFGSLVLGSSIAQAANGQLVRSEFNPYGGNFTQDIGVRGTISACAAYQKGNNSWSPDYRVNIAYMDGWHLDRLLRGAFLVDKDDLFLIIDWKRGAPTIINMQQRGGITTVPIVLEDINGRIWRVSRTWRHCSRTI